MSTLVNTLDILCSLAREYNPVYSLYRVLSSLFICSRCGWVKATIGVKIVETLLSFRGYFKLGSYILHPPHPPGQCCVIFCFLRPLTTAVQYWLEGRGKGFPLKYFFDYFSLKTIKVSSLVSSFNKLSQLILSPIAYARRYLPYSAMKRMKQGEKSKRESSPWVKRKKKARA